MDKSKSVFPNSLLSKEDFAKDQWKRCMIFVFMGRWVYGKDGQKQWRLFDMKDLQFNMRLFDLWTRKEAAVMKMTPKYQELPEKSDPLKRKRKRGRQAQKKKGVLKRLASSSSASESPMKRVVFDLTAFSSDDETCFQVREDAVKEEKGSEDEEEEEEDEEEEEEEENEALAFLTDETEDEDGAES